MSHEHHHHHVSGKNLFITIILNVIITLSQVVGGLLSGSLALLSDALHNFSDVIALVVAWWANRLSLKESTQERTFGYKRAEIIATLFNASALIGIGVFLIVEAIGKISHPEVIDSSLVIALGILSIVLNSASLLLIKDDTHNNMNIKAAYLHLLTDVMTSIAVVVGGVLMYYFKIYWADSLISLLIAFYLLYASVNLIKESTAILMLFSPTDIKLSSVIEFITQKEEIADIHHIHIWRLNEHSVHLEAHLDFTQNLTLEESNTLLETLEQELHHHFEIDHTTFQCEYNRDDNKSKIV